MLVLQVSAAVLCCAVRCGAVTLIAVGLFDVVVVVRTTISLKAVAMIKSDLYCKNCYLRIFHEKGQYSSFGEKTLPRRKSLLTAHCSLPAATASVHRLKRSCVLHVVVFAVVV
jgi:hypothetical protein